MKKNWIVLAVSLFLFAACKKTIQIDSPPNQLTDDKVFSNEATINAALLNMYTVINTIDGNFIAQSGLYTDELTYNGTDPGTSEYSTSILSVGNSSISNIWSNYYSIIYQSNLILEGVAKAPIGLADSIKVKASAEAKFLRAYCYFNLLNIYGDVPLITSTDVRISSIAPRTSSANVYQQIISDLKDSETGLPIPYLGGEKIRPNKYAVSALLAKVYLFNGDWPRAEEKANFVIQSGVYANTSLNALFLKNSNEAIWQLWNVDGFSNIGSIFIPASGRPTYGISNGLLNIFEIGDQRKDNWIKSTVVSGNTFYYPFKYKNRSTVSGSLGEYTMRIRLGELYLVRSEARAMQNSIANAIADVNVTRARAGLNLIVMPITKDSCLNLIEKERRVELFGEEGNRFYDLKRTQKIDVVLSLIKSSWKTTAKLYPVPQNELIVCPALVQNTGY